MLRAAVCRRSSVPISNCVLSVDALRMYKPRPEVYALVPAAEASNRPRRVRVLEPMGRDGRGSVRLPGGMDQSRQHCRTNMRIGRR